MDAVENAEVLPLSALDPPWKLLRCPLNLVKDFIEDTCGKIVHKFVSQSLSLIISIGLIFRILYKILRCLNMFDIAIVLICVHNIYVYIIDTRFT